MLIKPVPICTKPALPKPILYIQNGTVLYSIAAQRLGLFLKIIVKKLGFSKSSSYLYYVLKEISYEK